MVLIETDFQREMNCASARRSDQDPLPELHSCLGRQTECSQVETQRLKTLCVSMGTAKNMSVDNGNNEDENVCAT